MPLSIGLMNEEGFPHEGNLNYVSPEIDANTGTILVRGLFKNPNRDLLPGFFTRIKVPLGLGPQQVLLIPNRIIAEDQAGKYVLAVNKDDVVEQTRITTGQLLVGGIRVVEGPDDRRSRGAVDHRQGDPRRQGRTEADHHRDPGSRQGGHRTRADGAQRSRRPEK